MAREESAGASSRPLSPHLQIYKWPVTMATSITHRVTGVGNAIGTLLLAWWLIAAATGPEAHAQVQSLLASPLGRFVMFGFTLSLVYHLMNGIRHLFWDAGKGFSLGAANASGIFVFAGSLLATVALWAGAYWVQGGLQ